ncbi:MAG: hypothetical protein IKU37_08335 [Candidatus Gastranaerophilales bacterium]|nr:hypothetical protein [Candidatus Gastranaerophilales bacterium]
MATIYFNPSAWMSASLEVKNTTSTTLKQQYLLSQDCAVFLYEISPKEKTFIKIFKNLFRLNKIQKKKENPLNNKETSN